MLKKLYGTFLWIGFNCLKATELFMRRQFTSYHYVPGIPQNDERLNLEPPSSFEHRNPTAVLKWQASAHFSCQNENFVNTSKILWKNTEAANRVVLMKKACNFI